MGEHCQGDCGEDTCVTLGCGEDKCFMCRRLTEECVCTDDED